MTMPFSFSNKGSNSLNSFINRVDGIVERRFNNTFGGGAAGYAGMINSLNQLPTKDHIAFPSDLDDEHYMVFNIIKRTKPGKASLTKHTVVERSIVLPLPSSLNAGYSMSYNSASLGIVGSLAAGATKLSGVGGGLSSLASDVMNNISNASGQLKKIISGTDGNIDAIGPELTTLGTALGVSSSVASLGALTTLVGSSALGIDNVPTGLKYGAGIATNPHTAIIFDHVNFREFKFAYKLIAKNQQESINIKRICDSFRYHMHPNYAYDGLAYEYPDEFQMLFPPKLQDHLFRFSYCVLTAFDVTYNSENTPIFFEDTGAPVSVAIEMSFQETRPLTKDVLGTVE